MPSRAYAHLYNSSFWRKRAKAQLRDYPLCVMCLARKQITPARVADHITPHRGDVERLEGVGCSRYATPAMIIERGTSKRGGT